jgi:lysophospholipid acyltransferase (LPLAT)-like uncharacterized protein
MLIGLAGTLGPVLIRALGSTWRITVRGERTVEDLHASGRPAVFAFWHGVLLALEYYCRNRNIQVLSSLHRDGEISARVMEALGYGVVRGSSSRGSARGLVRMLERARSGLDLAITPDGPKGPAREAKSGIFYLAERSGGALVPVGVAARPAARLSSWDGFMVPLPFARVAIVYGTELHWDASTEADDKTALLTLELARLSEAAESLVAES